MILLALAVLTLDQATKLAVLNRLEFGEEHVVIPGFFKLVLWGNTGAAFHGNNHLLAIISLVAFGALVLFRNHFEAHRLGGQIALGLLYGGILGNLVDRLHPERYHVIDFLYFYVEKRGGGVAGFPAFNVADSAICIGVGLLFYLSWAREEQPALSPVGDAATNPAAAEERRNP
jgi:signal peptidase II